jgi:alpha-mannosidase
VSDDDRGVALLNRGLPGNNVADGVLMLSLMRSATIGGYGFGGGFEPGMGSDSGLELDKWFDFEYALLPHPGSWDTARTSREGLSYNHPLIARTAASQPGSLPSRWSFLAVDSPTVLVSALKLGDSDGVVLRLYESAGRATKAVTVRLATAAISAEEVNLMEDAIGSLRLANGSLNLDFEPFQIRTIKLQLGPGGHTGEPSAGQTSEPTN